MSVRVLVPAHFASELRERTSGIAELIPYDKDGIPTTDSAGARALFRWWLSQERGDAIIDAHPQLRWIHSGSAGIDHILTPRFLESGITLTNSSGVHAPSIAEWVVGSILAIEKGFAELLDQQKRHVWANVERDELFQKRVLIVGGGHIASEIARRLRPFGVTLACIRRSASTSAELDETYKPDALIEQVRRCDWLIIAVPLTTATRNMISSEIIAAMPAHARLINVARGEVVDEAALTVALRDRRIAGAVLDVFEKEPLPPEHPLWSLENVMILPHTTWRSPLVKERQLALFAENLHRFVRGETLLNVVNVSAYT